MTLRFDLKLKESYPDYEFFIYTLNNFWKFYKNKN